MYSGSPEIPSVVAVGRKANALKRFRFDQLRGKIRSKGLSSYVRIPGTIYKAAALINDMQTGIFKIRKLKYINPIRLFLYAFRGLD